MPAIIGAGFMGRAGQRHREQLSAEAGWSELWAFLAGLSLCLGVSPTDSRVCYATDYGASYRTLDGGATWEQVYSRNLPDSSVTTRGLDVTTCYGVHFDPFDNDHFFITYTDIGLFHSYNGGESWSIP